MSEGNATRSVGPLALMGLLFVSGAAALADEVAWVRLLADVFGTTAGATAVVLACFMGGMGAGALVLGKRADRSPNALRLYGILEIAAGALALLVPLEVRLFEHVYGALFRAAGPEAMWLLGPVRIVLASVALVPPAFAFGGTLPVLVRFVASGARGPGGIGFDVGRLYASNTAGAVVGCFATGYVLILNLGVLGTVILAGFASIAVGAAALVLGRRVRSAEAAKQEGDAAPVAPARRRWIVPALYGASGFVALGCEVLWTRSLVFLLHSTVYAFTSMLTVFLVGLAAGGAAGAFLSRRVRRPVVAFAALETGVAVSVALGILVLRAFAANWDPIDAALGSGWGGSVALHLALSAAVMIVPTFLFGMIFPVVARIHCEGAPAGASTGELLFANTIGAVAGSLAAGFVMIRLMGTAHSILALACVSLFVAAGAVVLLTDAPRRIKLAARVGAGLVSLGALLTVRPGALMMLFGAPNPKAKLVHAGEGPGGVVTVHRYPEPGRWLLMSVNGVSIAGTSPPIRSTQLLQGLIPTLVHGAPRRVLQIGIGTGETSRVVLDAGAERVTCVEISPEVVRATREYFGPLSRGVLDDPRYSLVYADAKNYLRHTRERFDLVLSDSTYPFLSGSSGLYTLDYFRDCRARLAPGGIASAWLPLDLPRSGLRSLLGTFAEAFPHATLWTTSGYTYKHALLLGSADPIRVRYRHVAKAVEQGGSDRYALGLPGPDLRAPLLARLGVSSVEEFTARLLLDRDGMLECARGAPLHTDDRPVLEYETALRAANLWRERLAENMAELNMARASASEHVDLSGFREAERAEITRRLVAAGRRASQTTDALVRRLRLEARAFPYTSGARRAWRRGRRDEAVRLYRKGLELHPGDERARVELRNLLLEMGRVQEAYRLERAATSRGGVGPEPPGSPREP